MFVECPELYYLLGEASTAIVAVEGTGMLLVNAGMTGGVAGVIYEGGRLVLTVEGTKLVSEGLRDAGASEGVIFLTEIATMTAIYGGIGLIKKSVAGRITATKGGTPTSRPTWRQSELDAATDFPDYDAQKSFINGEEVPYGTKGSVRPDYYKDGFSVDIKNYNVESASGRSNLARNIEKQYYQRIENLPDGTKQSVMIDVRGQNVSDEALGALYDDIMRRTNNGVEILFKMD